MVQYDQPHSYVWPTDYNWIKPHHAEVSNVNQVNLPVSSTEVVMPWLLSMWMNITPTNHIKHKSIKKFNRNGRNENGFKDRFTWGQIDLEYPNQESKHMALNTGKFIPINNLPLGLDVWKNKMFISLPQWRPGIPVTLAYVNLNSHTKSPILKPYPSWKWYTNNINRCHGLVSVFRMEVDKCNRLWVLDSGAINLAKRVDQICPVKLDIFDLKTDELIKRYIIPKNQTSQNSLFTNIVVELIDDNCEDAFAYISDVFQYGLVVYSYKKDTSHRINHPYFYPDPLYCHYNIDDIQFNWMDGIFGMCLSQPDSSDRILYFHSLSSNNEFYVPTLSLRNATLRAGDIFGHFVPLNESRCIRHQSCQSGAMAMDTNGVMYYNLVSKGKVGCWNSNQEFGPVTQGVLSTGSTSVSFPNDLKVDKEPVQRIWMLSNALHKYLYSKMNPTDVNFRVMMAYTDKIIEDTVCN